MSRANQGPERLVSLVAPADSATGAASAAAGPPPKPHFPSPAEAPTQRGPDGLSGEGSGKSGPRASIGRPSLEIGGA